MSTGSDQAAIWSELVGESDRATAVLGLAWIDESLEELLFKVIVSPENRRTKDDLFGPLGPFNTMYSKTEILFRFGFLPQIIYDDLNLLRQIRNQFGHSALAGMGFESPEIQQKTERLCLSEALINLAAATGDDFSWEINMLSSPRNRFVLTVGHMQQQLFTIAMARAGATIPDP